MTDKSLQGKPPSNADKNAQGNLPSSAASTTKPTVVRQKVKQSRIVENRAMFCHREADALEPAALQPLAESIRQGGIKIPPQVCEQADGTYVIITGHRRVKCWRDLAKAKVEGFSLDGEIEVDVLVGYTPEDQLLWSVEDNETRVNLTTVERMKVARKFYVARIPSDRAATALGISTKTYERDLLVSKHEWLMGMIERECLGSTAALQLIEAAEKSALVTELKSHLEGWIEQQKQELKELEAGGKKLSAGDKKVQNRMTPALLKQWVQQLKDKQAMDDEVKFSVHAGMDSRTLTVEVAPIRMNVATAPLEEAALLAGKLSQVVKDMMHFLETRAALEEVAGPQSVVKKHGGSPIDEDVMVKLGLGHLLQGPKQNDSQENP